MIKWFAKEMEKTLNALAVANGLERSFVIFADAGERPDVEYDPTDERSALDIEGKIYGVFDAQPSRMAPIPGVTVLSITGTLTVFPEVKLDRNSDSGQFDEGIKIEELLSLYARENNGRTYKYPDPDEPSRNNVEYNVAVNFSPVVCGDWEMHSTALGETVPLNMSVYLTAVESGVSSNDVTVYVDGYPIFYESMLPSRQKTLDQFTYENAPIKSVAVQHAFGLDIVFPLLKNRICTALLEELLDGSFTTPHSVVLAYPDGIEREYLCLMGSSNSPAKPGQNVGVSVSFVEAKRDVALKEIGATLTGLGEQFREKPPIPVGVSAKKSLTPGDLIRMGVSFEKGKRYTVAAAVTGYYPTIFKTFLYTGDNTVALSDVVEIDTEFWVRVTYGE
ncbi:MAG: hypothetical protein IJY71_07080 [Clostridia bacterium]|nr:hypothetical protein [Clostridia bacterium]